MTPDILFGLSNPLAMIGWVALALSPLAPNWAPRWADRVAGLAIPLILSVGYCALVLAHWVGAPGGFDTLPAVMALFSTPEIALAGWMHYLAFDLLIGAWITRTARADGIHHVLILPCLMLTFLFGPAGYLTFAALRASRAAINPHALEQQQ